MEENNEKSTSQKVDFIELIKKIWGERKFIFKVCGIAVLAAIIIGFSLPKEYTTKVILAPEIANKNGLSGGIGTLASMAGINLGSMSGEDALFPELYPKIIQSTPFLVDLFKVKVVSKKGDLNTTLYEYLDKHQKKPWWGYILQLPVDAFHLIAGKKDPKDELKNVDQSRLTMPQANIAKAIKGMIEATVDKKTDLITLEVTTQDPLISAIIADSLKNKLQKCIVDYRTNKARKDLKFSEKLYEQAREEYLKKQRIYANYSDGNVDIVMSRYKVEEERLEKEMTLAYTIYNQVAQQLQLAKAKVQEITPVYTVIQPPTVSLMASGPRKSFILIAFVFLSFFGSVGWILMKDTLKKLK